MTLSESLLHMSVMEERRWCERVAFVSATEEKEEYADCAGTGAWGRCCRAPSREQAVDTLYYSLVNRRPASHGFVVITGGKRWTAKSLGMTLLSCHAFLFQAKQKRPSLPSPPASGERGWG